MGSGRGGVQGGQLDRALPAPAAASIPNSSVRFNTPTAIFHLGLLASVRARAQPVTDHSLETAKARILRGGGICVTSSLLKVGRPGDPCTKVLDQAFVAHHDHWRYHEAPNKLTLVDVYFGEGRAIPLERERIKRRIVRQRRLLHSVRPLNLEHQS